MICYSCTCRVTKRVIEYLSVIKQKGNFAKQTMTKLCVIHKDMSRDPVGLYKQSIENASNNLSSTYI